MKTIFLSIFFLLFLSCIFSQTPEKFNYQTVVRNVNGEILANKNISIQVAILQGNVEASPEYIETFSVKTNDYGIVNIGIGNGDIVSGVFENIDWSTGPYFVKLWIDGNEIGTSQLLSVPYALYAKEAGNNFSGDFNDLTNIPADLLDGDNDTDTQLSESDVDAYVSNNGYLTEEIDPQFSASVAAGITAKDTTRWGYQPVPDANNRLSMYTADEILAMEPDTGHFVFNITDGTLQMYNGEKWIYFGRGGCWPWVTDAYVENDRYRYIDGTTQVTLSANQPEDNHGTGVWSILSGENGSFSDTLNPVTEFSGEICETYQLRWTISNECGSSHADVFVQFMHLPDNANAGADIDLFNEVTSVSLEANTPQTGRGTGTWTIINGTGGNLADLSDPNTIFSGQSGEEYTLQWMISTPCDTTYDYLNVSFQFFPEPETAEWSQTIDWNGENEYPQYSDAGINGGVITVGRINDGMGREDIIISKFTSNGEFEWSKQIGEMDINGRGESILTVPDGYLVVGSYNGNGIVLKLDQNGNEIWRKSPSMTETLDIVKVNDGYVCVGTDGDYVIHKMDLTGNPLWTKTYGGSSNDMARDISLTSDGGFIVCGFINSEDGDINTVIGYDETTTWIPHDYWILKLDPSGDMIWQNTVGSTGGEFWSGRITETSDGEFVFAGASNSTQDDWAHDNYIVMLNQSGAIDWEKRIGSSVEWSSLWDVKDIYGSFLVAGARDGMGILARYDYDGNLIWEKSSVELGVEATAFKSMSITNEGIYIIGESNGYLSITKL